HDAYFVQRFWLANRWYTVEEFDDGRRNLLEAFGHKPELFEDPEELLTKLLENALDLHIDDPVAYQERFLAELPAELAPYISPLAARLVAWTRVAIALRAVDNGDLQAATMLLNEASRVEEASDDGWRFLRIVSDRVARTPHDPVALVTRAYDLPAVTPA